MVHLTILQMEGIDTIAKILLFYQLFIGEENVVFYISKIKRISGEQWRNNAMNFMGEITEPS